MQVNVLHHGQCFDGAASAALFSAFYRRQLSPAAAFHYLPKDHQPGNPFEPTDFAADEVACLDFRYTSDERLTWFFDHHVSSFQLPGEREHFEEDESGRKFYDAQAPSCTSFIADILHGEFGFDCSPYQELLHWAEVIDTAAFPDPTTPVTLEHPALRLMTFVENIRTSELADRFIRDLMAHPLEKLANADYVVEHLRPILARHEQDIELLRNRCSLEHGVVEFELLDQPARAYNKFIPYHHHPEARYLIGLTNGPDGRIKLSAGYNPWLPPSDREHDIAALCERLGGGGHPFVGGASFDRDRSKRALEAKDWMARVLRVGAAP